jgi:hypothetical protein
MTKAERGAIFCVALYTVIGLLTFGYRYNRPVQGEDPESARPIALVCGAFWPFYWAGCAAIYITAPKELEKA